MVKYCTPKLSEHSLEGSLAVSNHFICLGVSAVCVCSGFTAPVSSGEYIYNFFKTVGTICTFVPVGVEWDLFTYLKRRGGQFSYYFLLSVCKEDKLNIQRPSESKVGVQV